MKSPFASRFLSFVAVLAAIGGPVAAEPRYTITDLGLAGTSIPTDPMGTFGINASGQVALYNSVPTSGIYSALLYSGFTFKSLGTLAGDNSSQAGAINDGGAVVGHSGTGVPTSSFLTSPQKMFLYSNGTLKDLGGAASPSVFAINNAGQVVGNAANHAFLYINGTFRDLGTLGGTTSRSTAINASGDVVGWSTTTAGDRHAFLYSGTTLRDLGTLGGASSQAHGINVAGDIVGYSATASGEIHAFLYRNTTMIDLGTPAGWTETRAHAINASGQIVGWGRPGSGTLPFLYSNGVYTDLNTLLPQATGPNGFAVVSFAAAINDAGQITGYGTYFENGLGSLRAFLMTPLPAVYPAAVSAAPNTTVSFSATTTLPSATYQWARNGIAIAGAISPSLVVRNVSSGDVGLYTCTVANANARATSEASALTVDSVRSPGRITNLAIRTNAGTDAQTLIVGYALGGGSTAETKPILIRGTGPALATFNVPGTLADPKIELYFGSTKLDQNDNWNGDAQLSSIGNQVGAFPLTNASSKDAALYRPALAAGGYTVQVSGVGGATGVALAEVYDATLPSAVTASTPRLINVSARAQVGTNSDILIAGFVIGGSTSKTVLIRAAGPALSQFNVGGVLANPQLQLFQGATMIGSNDNWGGDTQLVAVASSLGAFPLGDPASKDAVLLVTLSPGSYTAQLSGVGNTTGVGLIEIYEVP